MFNEKLFAEKLTGLVPYAVDTAAYKIRLDANESFIGMPEEMRGKFAKVTRALDFNRYPDPNADALCEAFAAYYGLQRENVCAGNGSDEIISILMNGFADKGDTVLTFAPDFSMYAFYASLAELRCVTVEKQPDSLQIDFDAADRALSENTVRMCIFSNPCNPTGRIEKKSDIVALAEKHPDTLFVVDEAYMDFAGTAGESFLHDAGKYANIIVLKTLSKALGSAALRVGFVVADTRFCGMFAAVKSPYNVNSLSQAFGSAILEEKERLDDCIARILASRDALFDGIVSRGIAKPAKMYTNFVFFEAANAKDLYEFLKKERILVRYFGIGGGALRITAGSPEENRILLDALERAVKQ